MGAFQEILLSIDPKQSELGIDTTFQIGQRHYHVFAYPSPGRTGPVMRWNLYEVVSEGPTREERLRGLTFGISDGVRAALEEVVRAAERFEATGEVEVPRQGLSFKPMPFD